jgi:hypothetical protein
VSKRTSKIDADVPLSPRERIDFQAMDDGRLVLQFPRCRMHLNHSRAITSNVFPLQLTSANFVSCRISPGSVPGPDSKWIVSSWAHSSCGSQTSGIQVDEGARPDAFTLHYEL